jgi:integrase
MVNRVVTVDHWGPYLQDPRRPLGTSRVSDKSLWADDAWRFPSTTAGKREPVILWRFDMPDGSVLTDPRWSRLLGMCRNFIWSLRTTSRRGAPLKDATLAELGAALRYLVRWMAAAGVGTFAEIDAGAVRDFVDHLVDDKAHGSDEDISAHTLARHLDVLVRIFEQRTVLSDIDGASMPEHPFAGEAAYAVAAKLVPRVAGAIPPVPDQVFLAVVPKAMSWLDRPAELVIEWARTYHRMNGETARVSNSYSTSLNRRLNRIWSQNADLAIDPLRGWTRSGEELELTEIRRMRRLIHDLRAACSIVLQSMLGLRISEVAGLQAEPLNSATGWPACVEVRPSASGLNEIFYVRGKVFKGRHQFQEVEWVAGSRPTGTDVVPPPIQAILVLERLFRPWREARGLKDLILSTRAFWHDPGTEAKPNGVFSDDLRAGQVLFVRDFVDLPEGFRDWPLSTHQWRKAFAQYVVRSDERLLPALSDHFKHLSIAMTEQGYLGSDPELLGLLDDVATREAARLLFDAVNGTGRVSGKMADTIRENAASIEDLMGTDGSDADRLARLTSAVAEDDVRVWGSAWGACMFRAETARCHHQAGGAFDLTARRPRYSHRQPSVCCSCSNLLVSDAHEGFWKDRYATNLRLRDESRAAGEHAVAAVAAERTRTAEAILRKMNIVMGGADAA